LNIIVCVKSVINTNKVIMNDRYNIVRDSNDMAINLNDLNAVEEGIRIKEQLGGKISVVSMGIKSVQDLLKDALALGVDNTVLLSDKNFAGADTLATAYTLAMGIKKINDYDLIICGKSSTDGCTSHVGPSIAERLKIPHITCVRKIVEINKDFIICERVINNGYEVVEAKLPALITVLKEINEPRYPSFTNIMKASYTEIPIWSAEDMEIDKNQCGLNGSPTQVIKTFLPERINDSKVYLAEDKDEMTIITDRLFDIVKNQY
jgi:electron transfer flavoprotein beta subunit